MLDEIDNSPIPESDENLLAVYGDDATFSRVGLFTLVHLDSPSPETIVRRTTEFDPHEFFVDDCPLCQASRTQGGHIVFSGSTDGDPDDEDGNSEEEPSAAAFAPNPLSPTAVALLRALDRLDVACDELVCALEPVGPAGMIARAIETVGFLHDRVADIIWDEDPATRLPALERIVTAALRTLDEVRAEHPALAKRAGNVDAAITEFSGSLRASFERPR